MKRLLCLTLLYLALVVPAQAAEFAVVQCAVPTADAGTVDCTSSGFGTPKGAFVWWSYGLANGTVVDSAGIGFGAFDGTRQTSRAFSAGDNLPDSDTGAITDADSALVTLSIAQAKDGDCTASFITDGIRLTCADGAPAAYLANVLLVGGSGVTSVYTGTATGNASQNGTTAVSSPGFTPDVILVWSNNNDTTHMSVSMGIATLESGPTIVQRAMSIRDANAAASMNVAGRLASNRVVTNPVSAATVEVTSFDANGFTVTTRDAAAGIPFGYLAIKLNALTPKLMTSAAPAGTGSNAVTGVGFRPQFGMMLQGEYAAVDTNYTTDDAEVFGVSAFTASGSASASIYDEDGDGTSNNESMTDNKVCRTRKGMAAADYSTCTLTSFDADGATFDYATNVGGAKQRVILFVQTSTMSGGGGGGQLLLGVSR